MEEVDELFNNCTWTWYGRDNIEFNDVAGFKVVSNIKGYTDRFIFLPAAGLRFDTDLSGVGSDGNYWSSSLHTEGPYDGRGLHFYSGYHRTVNYSRYCGLSVRPVCP